MKVMTNSSQPVPLISATTKVMTATVTTATAGRPDFQPNISCNHLHNGPPKVCYKSVVEKCDTERLFQFVPNCRTARAKTVAAIVKNLIRQQVVKLRQQHGWSQEKFAGKLQLAGWHNASRSTVSKIEGGSLCISDYDLLFVAAALRVHFTELFPEIDWKRSMDKTVHRFIPDEKHGLEFD